MFLDPPVNSVELSVVVKDQAGRIMEGAGTIQPIVPSTRILTVGGRFRVVMAMPEGDHTASGVYREIDPPRRLAFTWGWEEEGASLGPGESLVTVELEDRGDGTTKVVFTHEGFPSAESRDNHESGWASALNRLEALFG